MSKKFTVSLVILLSISSLAMSQTGYFMKNSYKAGGGYNNSIDGEGLTIEDNGDLSTNGDVIAGNFPQIDTESELESFLSDVTDILTDNDPVETLGTNGLIGTAPISNGNNELIMKDVIEEEEMDNLSELQTQIGSVDLATQIELDGKNVESFPTAGAEGTAPVSNGIGATVMTDIATQAELDAAMGGIDTEAGLEASLTDVTDVFTNNDTIPNGNVAEDLTITAGTIENTPIGASTANTGRFTTIQATGDITQSHAGDSQLLIESTDDNPILKLKGPSALASRLIWNEASNDAFQIYWDGTDYLNFYADNTLDAITAQVQESTGDWTFKYKATVDGRLIAKERLHVDPTSGDSEIHLRENSLTEWRIRSQDIGDTFDISRYNSGTFVQNVLTLNNSSGDGTFANNWTVEGDLSANNGTARIGQSDSVAGDVNAYGDSDTTGGEIRLYNGANDDTTVENFTFFANGDHVSFGQNGTSPDFNRVKFYDTGNIDMEGDLDVTGSINANGTISSSTAIAGNMITGTINTLLGTGDIDVHGGYGSTGFTFQDNGDFLADGDITAGNDLTVSGMQDIGTAFSANGDADDLVIGNGVATSGMTLHTNATGRPSIFFADTGSNAVGRITYQHNGNTLELYTNGSKKMSLTGSGEITDLSIHNNGGTGSAESIASGTYTPTLTDVANYSSVTGEIGHWIRVGDVVHVSLYLWITHTAVNTATSIRCTLPISSALGIASDCTGTLTWSAFGDSGSGAVHTDIANNEAILNYLNHPTQITHKIRCTFTYLVQ